MDSLPSLFVDDSGHYQKLFDRAKAMENEQIIEFSKLHVEAALKAKIEAMEKHDDGGYSLDELDSFTYNAYPLENIK